MYIHIMFLHIFVPAMRIEEEIKQTKFRSEQHKALINVIYTANWINSIHTRVLKKHGISPQQFNLLRILRGQYPKPATVNLLIERMMDKMSNASRLVDKLTTKKLVERTQCENDRRAVDVLITRKGLNLLSALDKEEKHMKEAYAELSEPDAKALNRILDKMRG